MSVIIQNVLPKSLAAKNGIQTGEKLISVNGQEVRDFLDLELLTSDYIFELEIMSATGDKRIVQIQREEKSFLGIDPEPYKIRQCENSCIFCFIDQMPPYLRNTLYVKDDDYLYSYVFGNYITLTNLKEDDYNRIIEQRITPLYVSLHTTDNVLRQKMMRSAQQVDALSILKHLSFHGISFHLQIVCVPGYNDGAALKRTLQDILTSHLNCLSIGVVPVGLTKYRQNLCELKPFNRQNSEYVLDLIEETRNAYHSEIIYPADEFYILAEREIPEESYYLDYPQLENGIGMLRLSIQNYKQKKRALLKELRKKPVNYLMIGSTAAQEIILKIAEDLNKRLENQMVKVQIIKNDFFGSDITVCGLITYADLYAQLAPEQDDTLILPSCIFNTEGETLDGKGFSTFKETWKNPILLIDQFFEEWDYL
ncbi:MAG: DUF512 domain-containing protein [Candidatus Cloacimonas sp.]